MSTSTDPHLPRHHDVYELRNLGLLRKLLATALLGFGLAVFALSWLAVVTLVSWNSDAHLLFRWGDALAEIAAQQKRLYPALFAMSVGSLLLLLAVSRRLFQRTAVRVRVRKAISIAAVTVLSVHSTLWALVPASALARTIAGPVGIITELLVLFYVSVPLAQLWIYPRWSASHRKRQRVVIVGGGFSGLYAAMDMDRALGHYAELEILLLDRNNYFLFPPLLPSAATGTVEPRQVTFPFRRILETTNIRFRMAQVERIDPKEQKVYHAREVSSDLAPCIDYDYLVLCPGSTTQTFGTKGVTEHAIFMRELADALAVRDRVIGNLEKMAVLPDQKARAELLRFVVVGAGPTGVEMATELHDLIYHVLLKRYPEVDPALIDIVLVQSGDQILPGWDRSVVKLAQQQLGKLRITLRLNSRVMAVEESAVVLKTGDTMQRLPASTCIWCAGVQPAPLLRNAGLALDSSGRALVAADLRAVGQERVFVLGDAAFFVDPKTKRALPPLGQVAFQQGSHTAQNLIRLLAGRSARPFRYFDFGALVSVGEHYAAVKLLGIRLSGFIGWLVWRTLYLMKLVGISNKVRVLLDWTLDLLIERSITQIGDGSRRPITDGATANENDGPSALRP